MFTGIVKDQGTIKAISRQGADSLLEVKTALDLSDIAIGDSLAVNGACLTVTGKGNQVFTADVSAETMSRTNLKLLVPGDRVNLEKALRVGDFLGGHLVLGHVDGLGRIRERREKSGSIILGCDVPSELSRFMVGKGSITIDGVSLTINECRGCRFYVNIIPHTWRTTTLGLKNIGAVINLEMDIIGKYVEKLLGATASTHNQTEKLFPGSLGTKE